MCQHADFVYNNSILFRYCSLVLLYGKNGEIEMNKHIENSGNNVSEAYSEGLSILEQIESLTAKDIKGALEQVPE